jgi:hypothetical protein
MEFNPAISKIKLNPEQAVLACDCVLGRYVRTTNRTTRGVNLCTRRALGTSRNSRSTQYCAQAALNDAT